MKAARWDQIPPPAAAAAVGKEEHPLIPSKPVSIANQSKPLKNYKSWRINKSIILDCLLASGGNVSFTRRYLLFKKGINVPKNVIHYYNSRYCSQGETQDGPPEAEFEGTILHC